MLTRCSVSYHVNAIVRWELGFHHLHTCRYANMLTWAACVSVIAHFVSVYRRPNSISLMSFWKLLIKLQSLEPLTSFCAAKKCPSVVAEGHVSNLAPQRSTTDEFWYGGMMMENLESPLSSRVRPSILNLFLFRTEKIGPETSDAANLKWKWNHP